jgi:LacI family transcriptional regulator, purine nucleotide synthesis repressor
MSAKKSTIRLSFESKDRALSLLKTLIRSRYFPEVLPNSAELSRLLRIPKTSLDYSLECYQSDGLIEPKPDKSGYVYRPHKNPPLGQVFFVVNRDILRGWYSLFQDWLIGVEDVLFEEGYETRVLTHFSSPLEKRDRLLATRKQGAMGFVLVSQVEKVVIESIVQAKIPSVTLGNFTIHQQDIGCVCSDNRSGVEKLISHLREEGHTRIAMYVNGLNFHDGFRERFAAYQHGLRQQGLEAWMELVFYELHSEVTARRAAEIFYGLTHRPSAIICGSDREAFELMAELRHLQIDVPAQVSVVGFDNNHYGRILEPPLTTVDICSIHMGRVAGNYLLNEMQEAQLPVKILLPTELILRSSTQSPTSCKTAPHPV